MRLVFFKAASFPFCDIQFQGINEVFALWREALPIFLIFQFKLFHPLLWLFLMRQQNKTDLCLSCKRLSVLITILPQECIHLVQFSTFLEFIILTQRVTRTHDYLLKLQDTDDNTHNFLELPIMYFQKSNPQLLFLGLFGFFHQDTQCYKVSPLQHVQAKHCIASRQTFFYLFIKQALFLGGKCIANVPI